MEKKEILKKEFEYYDSDKDGMITKEELQAGLKKYHNKYSDQKALERSEKILKNLDSNNSNNIDINEFLTLLIRDE